MKKPNQTILKLYDMGKIKSISIDYIMDGVDTASTFWNLVGLNGEKCRLKSSTAIMYININIDWNSIGCLRLPYRKQVEEWNEYEIDNKNDLDEYERLKKKFGEMK